MRLEELEVVCQEAARNAVERSMRPVPATVVLPLPSATRVTALLEWPDDDTARYELLHRFAHDVMQTANAPCFGFLAEAIADVDGVPTEILVVAYGARGHQPQVMAAPLDDEGLGDFSPSEPLDATAFPFLAPLQQAAAASRPPDAFGGLASG